MGADKEDGSPVFGSYVVKFIPEEQKQWIEIQRLGAVGEDEEYDVHKDEGLFVRYAQSNKKVPQVAWKEAVVCVLDALDGSFGKGIFTQS